MSENGHRIGAGVFNLSYLLEGELNSARDAALAEGQDQITSDENPNRETLDGHAFYFRGQTARPAVARYAHLLGVRRDFQSRYNSHGGKRHTTPQDEIDSTGRRLRATPGVEQAIFRALIMMGPGSELIDEID